MKHQVNLYTAGDEYMAGIPTLKKAKSFFSNILDSKQAKKEYKKIDESVEEYETQKYISSRVFRLFRGGAD